MGSGEANTPAWLTLLFVIAVVSFFVLGDLIAHRQAHAPAWAGLTTTESSGEAVGAGTSTARATEQTAPLTLLAQGIAESAASAAEALSRGDVTAGAVAMDAAMRAVDVGRDGAPEPARSAFDSAYRLVRLASRKRQNGDPGRAATILRLIGPALRMLPVSRPVLPHDVANYDGARLLNAEGTMLGVVDRVSIGAAGEPFTAVLVIGGYHQVLGFLDFGGTKITVPAARLVFGKARALGATRVVLATTARTPSELLHELGSVVITPSR